MKETADKVKQLQSLLQEKRSHHLFVRFHTKERHITGPLQEMSVASDGSITCFFCENGKIEVIDIHEAGLIDVVVFCNAEFKPVFLKDFQSKSDLADECFSENHDEEYCSSESNSAEVSLAYEENNEVLLSLFDWCINSQRYYLGTDQDVKDSVSSRQSEKTNYDLRRSLPIQNQRKQLEGGENENVLYDRNCQHALDRNPPCAAA